MTFWKSIHLSLAIAFLAFGLGWLVKGWQVKATAVTVTKAVVTDTAKQIVQSAQVSTTLETAIRTDATRVDGVAKAVAERIANNTPQRHDKHPRPETAAQLSPVQCDVLDSSDPVLDAGSVRLLNLARQGVVDAATSDTGKK
jgi:hypothetical protein